MRKELSKSTLFDSFIDCREDALPKIGRYPEELLIQPIGNAPAGFLPAKAGIVRHNHFLQSTIKYSFPFHPAIHPPLLSRPEDYIHFML